MFRLIVLVCCAAVPTVAQPTQVLSIRGHQQTLRMYGVRGGRPVIVSSGDGGWIHIGPHVAELLAANGYFVVGFDARAYHVIAWGKAQGYQRFALGMAPLSGFEASPRAPSWSRLGAFLYEHGEAVYSFQGLRAFKEKFNPAWEPRYLAYPGGLRLPLILADTSALIAGGYRRILMK